MPPRSYRRTPLYFFPVLAIVLLMLLAVPSVIAQSEGEFSEKEAQTIDRMIMCPVCPAETIDQAQVEISFQMRALVREMLADGKSRQEILDFFVTRYGADILASPPKSGVNLLAWFLPIAGVAVALVGVYFVIRSMTARGHRPVSMGPSNDPSLVPYLEMVDRQLDLNRPSPAITATQASGSHGNDVDDAGGTQEGPETAEPNG